MTGKRTISGGLGGAALASAAAQPAAAQAIKIGIVNSYTGFLAGAGDEMDKGIYLYVKTHQKDLPPGVTVELIKRDDTSARTSAAPGARAHHPRPGEFHRRCGGLAHRRGDSTRRREAKTPLVITNAAGAGITRISPYVVRFSFTIWQQGLSAWQMDGEAGLEKRLHRGQRFIPGMTPSRLHQGLHR